MRKALGALHKARWSSLVEYFDPSPKVAHVLTRVVDGLIASGEVTVDRRGVYSLVADGPAVRGVVERVGGDLIVVLDDGSQATLKGRCRPGDVVLGAVRDGAFYLHEVAKPSPRAVLGQVTGYGRRLTVDAIDPLLRGRIDIVEPSKAVPGDIVEVQVLSMGERSIDGRILAIVDGDDEADRAAQVALAAFDIPSAWPFDVTALRFDEPRRGAASREDLSTLPLVTIDGETAKDFDDAVYAERRPRGGWRLIVAIADVSHYVRPFDEIDREAERRGNSVYLPDRVVPMLPLVLSDHVCSLVPGRLRYAMVCDMLISANGRLSGYRFGEAVIRSHQRLTYTEVAAFLDGRDGSVTSEPVRQSLSALHEVYRALGERRDARGAIDLDAPEASVVVEGGEPQRVELRERHDAHRIIEEAMILANVAAARHLEKIDNAAPAYRVHEPPSLAKLKDLSNAFSLVGEELPADVPTPLELRDVATRVKAKSGIPDVIWDMIVLRSMSQARYEPKRLGHFGLALPSYVHFTSPIRRYADLLVHRQLKGHKLPAEYVDVCAHISVTERRAESAERLVSNWLKCTLIEDRIGETLTGRIAGVTGFGVFVELDEVYVQGLLHISNLGRERFEYVPKSMAIVAQRSGMRFTIGDRMHVVLDQVSPATGRVDLSLPVRGERARRGRGRRRQASR